MHQGDADDVDDDEDAAVIVNGVAVGRGGLSSLLLVVPSLLFGLIVHALSTHTIL